MVAGLERGWSKGIEYCFNARRELIASDRRLGNGCGVRTNYRYDLNHNRIGQNQYRYQHNAADQLLNYPGPGTAANLSYNSQGQANQVGNLALTYNQSQQIKTAQNGSTYARYEYDASGRRMAKEINGEREEYLMLGQEVLKTFDGSGNVKADYFLGQGREGLKTDGSWKYYLSDGLGSTALLTDGAGNTVAAYDYEDYGTTTQIAGSDGVYNPYRYTGQEWDAELGMYNLRARHYSPSLGRFLARDPIGFDGGLNLMAYCNGDPIDFVDPSGTVIQLYNNAQTTQAAPKIQAALNAIYKSPTGNRLLSSLAGAASVFEIIVDDQSKLTSNAHPGFAAIADTDIVRVNKGWELKKDTYFVVLSLAKFTGTTSLVGVLAHEFGHVYQAVFESCDYKNQYKDKAKFETTYTGASGKPFTYSDRKIENYTQRTWEIPILNELGLTKTKPI